MESYKEKYEQALIIAKETYNKQPMYREWLGKMFPELAESEDEKVRQKILFFFYAWRNNEQVNIPNKKEVEKAIAWLEKQGNESVNIDIESMVSSYEKRVVSQCNGVRNNPIVNMCVSAFRHGIENTLEELNLKKLENQGGQMSIINIPSRDVILAIWDLGNEWKELTNGSISTEYGTQLDYIQKHWHESEYYLREKQGEQTYVKWSYDEGKQIQINPSEYINDMGGNGCYFKNTAQDSACGEEDGKYMSAIIKMVEHCSFSRIGGITKAAAIDWLKSLRPQNRWKPSVEQMDALWFYAEQNNHAGAVLTSLYNDLKKLKEEQV